MSIMGGGSEAETIRIVVLPQLLARCGYLHVGSRLHYELGKFSEFI